MTTFTGDAGINNITGTDGDDFIDGREGNDTLNGAGGNDILVGGPGADILTGGNGADIFRGSAAELNGDTITDFLIGDRIQFLDLTAADARTIHTENNNLVFNGGSLTIDNLGPGRFVLREISGGGIELRLQAPAHNDFDGDGRSDILWRNDNGTITEWLGTSKGSFTDNSIAATYSMPANWHVVGTGDFNGDGRGDVLWGADDGTITNWLGQSNGSFFGNWDNFNNSIVTSWNVAGTGDFNGDGRDDILWRNNDGRITEWLATANGSFTDNSSVATYSMPANWHVVTIGDFNGDAVDDVMWGADDGTISNWLGQPDGSFFGNWNNFNDSLPTSWHVVDPLL